jgi:hypothetical protein
VEGEPAHVGRADPDTRPAQLDQSPGGRIDQGRIRAKHSFQRWLELAYDMPLGERADPVHLHVPVEHPHSVRPQPGKRASLRRTRHTAQYFDPSAAPITKADARWAIEKATEALAGTTILLSNTPHDRFA